MPVTDRLLSSGYVGGEGRVRLRALILALLVVGSQNSSNSRRLVEVCEKAGVPAYLLDDCSEVHPEMSEGPGPFPERSP